MNRRGFLAGLVAAPVVAAVPSVLARLAPHAAVAAPAAAPSVLTSMSHGGGRLVINDHYMAVYDGAGVERVKFGVF